MRPNGALVDPPLLNDPSGGCKIAEQLRVEALVAEAADQALREGVLHSSGMVIYHNVEDDAPSAHVCHLMLSCLTACGRGLASVALTVFHGLGDHDVVSVPKRVSADDAQGAVAGRSAAPRLPAGAANAVAADVAEANANIRKIGAGAGHLGERGVVDRRQCVPKLVRQNSSTAALISASSAALAWWTGACAGPCPAAATSRQPSTSQPIASADLAVDHAIDVFGNEAASNIDVQAFGAEASTEPNLAVATVEDEWSSIIATGHSAVDGI